MLYNVAQFILLVNKQIPHLHNLILYLLILVAVWYDKTTLTKKERDMFKTTFDGDRIDEYRWKVRRSWRQLDREAGLSYGYLKQLINGKALSMHVSTVDAVANAIARLLTESGQPVPDDLWYQIIKVEWVAEEDAQKQKKT